MTVKPASAELTRNPAAGAVVLWCLLAGAAASSALLIEPEGRRGLDFLSPEGAQRLLADLAVLYVLFIVPLFAWRKEKPLRAGIEATATVAFTAAVGLVMIDNLVGLGAAGLAKLIGFLALSSASAVLWTGVLREKPGAYFAVASTLVFGAPLIQFFAAETLSIDAVFLGWLSPLTAWRGILDSGAWAPWIVFSAILAAGAVALAVKLRRAKP